MRSYENIWLEFASKVVDYLKSWANSGSVFFNLISRSINFLV